MPSFTHEDKAEGFLVPATDPKHIHFQLNTASQIVAGRKRKPYGVMAPVHGFRGLGNSLNFREGGRISDAKSKPARSTLEELIWLSESCKGGDNEHGRWQRRVRFDSDIELACCPTFQTDLMDIQVPDLSFYYHILTVDSCCDAVSVTHPAPFRGNWQ
jgi:hypothetical protein